MATKFTADDLFRIGEDHLSRRERFEFRFRVETAGFRRAIGEAVERDLNLDADERNLLERIFSKFRPGVLGKSGR